MFTPMNHPIRHWAGQRIWLIGASSGIGAALAQQALAAGAKVAVSARREEQLRHAQEIARLGSFDWYPVSGLLRWSDEHFRLWGLAPGAVTPDYALFRAGVHSQDVEELERVLEAALAGGTRYACRHRVIWPDGTVRGATARYVADAAALAKVHSENLAAGTDTIVQVPVAGEGLLASVLLREDGETSLVFVHRRVRESRPEGGPSACAVSIAPDARFVDPARHLAQALGLVGVPAQFEFRVDGDAPPVLLDVNPRPWGTLGLALDCGVNFYGLAARHATGDPLPSPPPPYRAGVERHYLPFEVLRAWSVVFGHPQPGYPGPWPDRSSAAFEWLFLPHEGLVGKLDDPLPAFGDLVRLAVRAMS